MATAPPPHVPPQSGIGGSRATPCWAATTTPRWPQQALIFGAPGGNACRRLPPSLRCARCEACLRAGLRCAACLRAGVLLVRVATALCVHPCVFACCAAGALGLIVLLRRVTWCSSQPRSIQRELCEATCNAASGEPSVGLRVRGVIMVALRTTESLPWHRSKTITPTLVGDDRRRHRRLSELARGFPEGSNLNLRHTRDDALRQT